MEGPVRHSVRSLSRSESLESSAPEDFLDPITMVLMEHPVTLPEVTDILFLVSLNPPHSFLLHNPRYGPHHHYHHSTLAGIRYASVDTRCGLAQQLAAQ